ncbi:MAG: C40 family peptidase [Variovorax sp.]
MRFMTLLPALLLSTGALAAPTQEPDERLQALLEQRILVERITHVGQQVTDRAADLVGNALEAIGVPYRSGGSSAESGFDCSGFVRAMFDETVGLMLPRRAEEQAAATTKIDRGELKPGDLVFFNTMRRAFSHVGIYLGDNKFIHAPRSGGRVRVEDMSIAYWQRRFNGARRVEAGAHEVASIGY